MTAATEVPRARHTQEYLHGADATGRAGDCLRASVASILGMPLEQVPHFADVERRRDIVFHPEADPADLLRHAWWWTLVGWAALLDPPFDVVPIDPTRWPDPDDPSDPLRGCYLLTGPSPRGPWNHTVVARAGRVVWDPHPSRVGFVGPATDAERLVPRPCPTPMPDEVAPCGAFTP